MELVEEASSEERLTGSRNGEDRYADSRAERGRTSEHPPHIELATHSVTAVKATLVISHVRS